ncbi:HflC protein [Arcticibacter svalbardensis MN12-7]|uniref:Protein HflC n=1 Tax=Arcticibacter svalbardensis MN12-7 TaxID=1150600 RepID=R9GVD6_9SPHI|nr:protease modulator HflC [Arcticibacter svalbardensis]EOR92904.1 HflC protein [Arcticibacter svalbardensis MN12-7]
MKSNRIIIGVIGFLVLLGLLLSVYTVKEYEQVVITQFGRPIGKAITAPGIYMKIPFIQTANVFEKRYMEWNGDPNQVPTKDKKFIFVDTYSRWQITDPLQFFKRLTNERGAQSRLDDILDGETRNVVAKNNIEEIVRTSNRKPEQDSISEVLGDSLTKVYVGRDKMQNMILASANKQAKELGITILDFRFKRINYVKEVQTQVYERMKSERYRIADKFRSEGQGEASRINGEKDRELKNIQSTAFKTAEEIKGKADASAASIYAAAYNQSAQSKNLYSFLKSMETLEKTFTEKTSVVLSTNSEIYKYLKKSD